MKMNPYASAKDGSTWAKWDLHIHTPETKLSDAYSTTDGADPWKKFIKKIDTSDVRVIGITDYFSIDNYEKFINLYNAEKHLVNITFFPNIEFRLDVSVNKDAEEVNIHVIFSNDTPIQEIRHFLDRLDTNISISGRKIPCSQLQQSQFKTAAINISDLKKSLESIFGNQLCYIIGGACNGQGLRPNTESRRKINIAENIERECHFIFGNSGNTEYYLGKNRYKNGELSDEKPVLSGSDAHSFADLDTKLGKDRFYTWIKAMPTFSGLRQILFEPEDRVKIQNVEPDYKEPHNIIKSISINDNAQCFGEKTILLNKNLNTIIGGKSSGKSFLLYCLAQSIDEGQLRKLKDKFGEFKGYNIDNVNVNIEWADGLVDTNNTDEFWDIDETKNRHKITYIPQLYINHLAEKNGREELNNIINEILLQNSEYKKFKENIDTSISETNERISNVLNNLMELRNELLSISEEKKRYSTSDIYDREIENLNKEYIELNKLSSFTREEIEDYKRLKAELSNNETQISLLTSQGHLYSLIKTEIENQKDSLLGNEESGISGSLNRVFNKFNSSHINITRIIEIIEYGYSKIIQDIDSEFSITEIEKNIRALNDKKADTEKELAKYNDKISSKSGLPEIIAKTDKLKNDKNYKMELDLKFNSMLVDYQKTKSKLSDLLACRNQLYQLAEKQINEKMNILGSEISLSCKLVYDLDSLKLFDYINRSYTNNNIQSLFDEESRSVNYKYLPDFFSNLIRVENSKLLFKDKTDQPLKVRTNLESVFSSLIEDNFYITYDVRYKGDNLLKMSPGKKGTVLLILFLELSSSENPILIDQPEDNLDNRTIYDLLCKLIKNKKRDRQIIIVTHNANLVVNTDAENIIIANQEGQDPATEIMENRTQFEYINGPIELSFKYDRSGGVLTKMGIKQHVCDILEGGKEAFRLRERKYQEELGG
jgi:ABC-type cobalamin/Fe3+-siderophores transport system ATPase subunit